MFIRTVTIAETTVMITPAMAEMIALMAPPIAETTEPFKAVKLSWNSRRSHQKRTIVVD
jgi:hypothetical protein